jgi:hypothetical protein
MTINRNFQVEVQQNDHLVVARLEERVLNVVVEHIDLIATQRRVAEA